MERPKPTTILVVGKAGLAKAQLPTLEASLTDIHLQAPQPLETLEITNPNKWMEPIFIPKHLDRQLSISKHRCTRLKKRKLKTKKTHRKKKRK